MSGALINGKLFLSSTFLIQIYTSTVAVHQPDCPLVISPPKLVVRFGDSASASCNSTVDISSTELFGWEFAIGTQLKYDNSSVTRIWDTPNVDKWGTQPLCFITWEYMTKDNRTKQHQCERELNLTVYQPPERVFLTVENVSLDQGEVHLAEGRQYRLHCQVQNVAPVQDLRVLFRRGPADVLGVREEPPNSSWPPGPQNRSYWWDFTARAQDDRVWCEARLEMGAAGPTPAVTSDPLLTTVHFPPKVQTPSSDKPISITEGDTLELSCNVLANPAPTYSWTLPYDPGHAYNESMLVLSHVWSAHTGYYTCVVNNTLGSASLTYRVEVKVDWLPIIAGLVGAGILVAIVIGVVICRFHHSQTKTGRYDLRNILQSLRCASDHVALPNGSPW